MNSIKNACTIYLFRHGQTVGNQKKIIQGQTDTPLTREGIEGIRNRAKKLKRIKFSAFYSSDLLRAERTAKILAAEHNLTVSTTQLIRERHFGKQEGKHFSKFTQKFDELFKQREQLSSQEQMKFKLAPDIESDEEVMTRFISYIRQAALAHPNQNIGIVSHGGVLRTFLVHLGWATYQQLIAGTIENVSYIQLKSDGIEFEVIKTYGIHIKE